MSLRDTAFFIFVNLMPIINAILLSLLPILFMESCFSHWTEKQKQEFEKKCMVTDTVSDMNFTVTGFDYPEVEHICVKQIHQGRVVDSFYAHADKSSFDSLRTRYRIDINRPIYIKDNYEFVVSKQDSFLLSDMKMVMWAQFSMTSEGYGCVMGDYKIDGKQVEQNASPDFVKKGFKYPWE